MRIAFIGAVRTVSRKMNPAGSRANNDGNSACWVASGLGGAPGEVRRRGAAAPVTRLSHWLTTASWPVAEVDADAPGQDWSVYRQPAPARTR